MSSENAAYNESLDAAVAGDLNAVKKFFDLPLIEEETEVDRNHAKNVILNEAIKNGRDDIVDFAIDAGVTIIGGHLLEEALQAARENGYAVIVSELRENMVLQSTTSAAMGEDPLFVVAAQYGHMAILTTMTEDKSLDLEQSGKSGYTALAMASLGNHVEATRLLLDRGANVNARNIFGNTPVMDTSSLECTQLLVEHGAKLRLKNHFGETARDKAKDRGYRAQAHYLKTAPTAAIAISRFIKKFRP